MRKKKSGNRGLRFCDGNVFIGKHKNPFITSPFTVKHLSEIVKRNGFESVLVYHSASVDYEASYGNQLLIEDTRGVDFLRRVWIVLPEHCSGAAAAEQFLAAARQHSVVAMKIFPRTHYFTVKNGSMDALFSLLRALQMPLIADQDEISWDEVFYILDNFPGLNFVLANTGYRLGRFVYPLLGKYPHFHLEISRFQVHRGLEEMCRLFGSNQLLFGSGLPIFSPEPAMMMIHSAKIAIEDKHNIAGENLRRLLRIVPT